MSTRYGNGPQDGATSNSAAKMCGPLFLRSDLLLDAPAYYLNIYLLRRGIQAGCAWDNRQKADEAVRNNTANGIKVLYRIVVRPKTFMSTDAPVKQGEPA